MVLTHVKSEADYFTTIDVANYVGGGELVGEATMSFVKANGDVVSSDTFSQYTPGSLLNERRRRHKPSTDNEADDSHL